MRDSEERQYSSDWLQVGRPQPMYNDEVDSFLKGFYPDNNITALDVLFKQQFFNWLTGPSTNKFTGFAAFPFRDISYGCTQFIDDIYQRIGPYGVKVLKGDYTYHWRLNNDIQYLDIDSIEEYQLSAYKAEVIIALPFPTIGDVHPRMNELLDKCHKHNIPVHIDGAWIGSCANITFNFDHPAIKTFCISLSKAGMGSNRVGIRFSRDIPKGAISIMNEFNMQQQALLKVGIGFMERFPYSYLWDTYEEAYFKICQDFRLDPTNCIHLAMRDGGPVGIRPLLRSLIP